MTMKTSFGIRFCRMKSLPTAVPHLQHALLGVQDGDQERGTLALGKLTQQVSRELDNVQRKFMNPIFTTSRGSKAVKSFRETSVLPDSQPQSPKIWAYQHVTPSPQSHAYWPPLCPWSSPLEQKRGWPPACSPQQVLPRKWTPTTCCSHSKGRHWHFSLPVQMGYPVVESSEEPLLLIFQLLVKMWVLRRPVCDKDGKTYAS